VLEKGTKVAGYEIEGVLGHGGMGVVYEARQLSLGRTVALKILAGTLGMDPSFKERFRHEGRIQAALDHPHIVTIFEAGAWDDSLFIAMRLVRGPNLKEMIIARELEGARTLRILRPIAEALDSAHEAGLIHRDIKPQNILVGSRDRAYLADFGLTKGIDDAGLTQTGQFVGTIDYIAPEQIRGEPATGACDIYALSAVLYECLTGAVPYPKPSDAAVMYAHLSEPPPLVTDQRPELPPNLDEVICKAMDKDPTARYATASALIEEAERALGKRVRAVITPPGPIEGPEEAGIREKESRVPTRPERVRRPRETAPEAPANPTAPGAAPRTTAPGTPPALAPAAAATAAAASLAAPANPTVAGPADPTIAAPVVRPESAVAAPTDPTVAAPAIRPEDPVAEPASATVASPAVQPEESAPVRPPEDAVAAPADPTVASPAVRPSESTPDAPPAVGPEDPIAAPAHPTVASPAVRSSEPMTSPPTVALPAAERGASARRRAPSRVASSPTIADQIPERRTTTSRFPFAIAAVVLVVAGIVGYLLGKPGDEPASPRADTGLSSSTTAGALGLRFPGSWERRGEAPKIPGLPLRDQVAVGPAGEQGRGVIAGMSDAKGPMLLPAAFLSGLPGKPRDPDKVKLGRLEALRYEGLQAGGFGGRSLTLFTSPTSSGVATIACYAPPGEGSSFRADCDRVASSLTARGVTTYPVGADPAYAAGISRVFSNLAKRRKAGRTALAGASTKVGQSQAAASLADTYALARADLGGIETSPVNGPTTAAIGAALQEASRAYKRLAAAKSAAGFTRAGARVRRAEARVDSRLAGLKALGYETG
jgi:Protein kinase domain